VQAQPIYLRNPKSQSASGCAPAFQLRPSSAMVSGKIVMPHNNYFGGYRQARDGARAMPSLVFIYPSAVERNKVEQGVIQEFKSTVHTTLKYRTDWDLNTFTPSLVVAHFCLSEKPSHMGMAM